MKFATRSEARLIGYSFGNFGKNLVWSAADISLLFLLTETMRIPPATAGLLLFLAMLGDIVCDILVGGAIGRSGAPPQRFRNVMLIGAPLCGAAFAFLYALPWLGLSASWLIVAATLVFRAGYSLVDVPHNTLLANVTRDSRGRGRVAGYRFLFSSLATLCVAAALEPMRAGWGDATRFLAVAGLVAAFLFCGAIAISWTSVRATEEHTNLAQPLSWRDALVPSWSGPFLALAGIAFLTGFALPLFTRTLMYRGAYVVQDGGFASSALTLLVIGQFAGVAIWTLMVRRFEKTTLLGWAHLVTATAMAGYWLAGSGSLADACILMIGFGLAGVFMLPWAILADLVDLDEFRCRRRREIAMFTTFLVCLKLGAALSIGMVGFVLDMSDYGLGHSHGFPIRLVIDSLGSAIPIFGAILCFVFARWLPTTHRNHAAIMRSLKSRTS